MKSFPLILITLIICSHVVRSRTCQWVHSQGGSAEDVSNITLIDSSGNLYVAGYFYSSSIKFNNGIALSNSGSMDAYISKYNKDGKCLWAEKIGGNNVNGIKSIAIDKFNNIYLIGHYGSQVLNFNNGFTLTNFDFSNFEVFIAKYNCEGKCQWAEKIGGDDGDFGYGISVDDSCNAFITGYFTSYSAVFNNDITLTNTGSRDVFIAKYNTYGTCQWAQKIGGTNSDYATSISLDKQGNIYSTGNFLSNELIFNNNITLANKGDWDVYVAKYNPNGICQWAQNLGGSGRDESWGMAVDGLGSPIVTGFYFSDTLNINNGKSIKKIGYEDAYLVKYNTNGICEWAESIGGNNTDYGVCVTTDASNDIYFGGCFYSTTLHFNNRITLSQNDKGDAFFAKYSKDGICKWSELIAGTELDEVRSISAQDNGIVYIAGRFNSPRLIFNKNTTLINSGNYDAFIAKYIISK